MSKTSTNDHCVQKNTIACAQRAVLGVIPGFVKHRPLGRDQTFALVLTEDKLIFALQKRSFSLFRRKIDDGDHEAHRYYNMNPDDILKESLTNYYVPMDEVIRLDVREVIPFTLMYSPFDAMKNVMVFDEDDVVLELPNVIKRDVESGREEAEKGWELYIYSRRATLSFMLYQDPTLILMKLLGSRGLEINSQPSRAP